MSINEIQSINLQSDTAAMNTRIDADFAAFIDYLNNLDSTQEMCEAIRHNLRYRANKDKQTYNQVMEAYNRLRHWGEYYPGIGVRDLAENAAKAMYEHRDELAWLYEHLGDYRSKKLLYQILSFWLSPDPEKIKPYQERYFTQYFDIDLVPCTPNEVFVDVGAYIGDTMVSYKKVFGADGYRRIYCYEPVPESVEYIYKNIELFHLENIVVRPVGVSDEAKTLYLPNAAASQSKTLMEKGEVPVETVTLDEDMREPVSFIKVNVCGMEDRVLRGCQNIIRQYHPRIAAAAYYGHDGLWRLARTIDEIDPTYRFYLRCYGDQPIPAEYILYAV